MRDNSFSEFHIPRVGLNHYNDLTSCSSDCLVCISWKYIYRKCLAHEKHMAFSLFKAGVHGSKDGLELLMKLQKTLNLGLFWLHLLCTGIAGTHQQPRVFKLAGDRTQDFLHGRHILYHQNGIHSPITGSQINGYSKLTDPFDGWQSESWWFWPDKSRQHPWKQAKIPIKCFLLHNYSYHDAILKYVDLAEMWLTQSEFLVSTGSIIFYLIGQACLRLTVSFFTAGKQ